MGACPYICRALNIPLMKTALLFFVFCCVCFWGKAQPAYLDSTFNSSGLREDFTQSLPADYRAGYVRNLIIQPDEKTLGLIRLDSASLLVRLLPNGSEDLAFATAGRYLMEATAPYTNLSIESVALQPDGKILITGSEFTFGQTGENKIFMRLESNGALDAGFGSTGRVTISEPKFKPNKILVRPNGKIVLIGSNFDTTTHRISNGLFQFTASGKPDSSFGINGWVDAMPDSSNFAAVTDAALLPDGRVVTVSDNAYTNYGCVAIGCFATSGNLDATFGNGGWTKTIIQNYTFSRAVAVQSTGKILVGFWVNSQVDSLYVQRFNTNGILDVSFASTGTLRYLPYQTPSPYANELKTITVLAGDTLLLGATMRSSLDGQYKNFGVMRILPDGVPDINWGFAGLVEADFNLHNEDLFACVGRPDGSILAGGGTHRYDTTTNSYPAIAQFKSGIRQPSGTRETLVEKPALSIYPNPCTGTTTIAGTVQSTLILYNGRGQLLQKAPLSAGNAFQYSVSGLVPGVYLIGILGSSTSSFQKLVVTE